MVRLRKWWRVCHWTKINWSWRDQSGWPWSSQSQSDLILKCSKWLTLRCSLTDLEVLIDLPWSAHWLTLRCSLTDLEVLTDWPWSAHWLTLKCSLTDLEVLTDLPWSAHWLTLKCSLTDLEVLTDWPWSAHWLTLLCSEWLTLKCSEWLTLKCSLTDLEVLNMDVPLPFGEFGSISVHQNNTRQTTNNDLTHCSNTTALLPSNKSISNASWCQVRSLTHSSWISCHEKVQMWKRISGVKFRDMSNILWL